IKKTETQIEHRVRQRRVSNTRQPRIEEKWPRDPEHMERHDIHEKGGQRRSVTVDSDGSRRVDCTVHAHERTPPAHRLFRRMLLPTSLLHSNVGLKASTQSDVFSISFSSESIDAGRASLRCPR